MIGCPICGKRIDYLEYSQKEESYGNWYGEGQWDEKGCEGIETQKFYCPECGNQLSISNENEAMCFIMSGDINDP